MDRHGIHQAALDSMSDPVYVRDRDKNLVYINPAAERLTGWSLEEALGKKCYEVFGDDDGSCVQSCPSERMSPGGQPIWHHERVPKTREGEPKAMRVSISLLREDGQTSGAVAVMKDISWLEEAERSRLEKLVALEQEVEQRRRMARQLRAAEREKSLILGSVQDVVAYLDLEHRIVWTNQAAADAVDASVQGLIGRRCHEVWHQRDRTCDGCAVSRAMAHGQAGSSTVATREGGAWRVEGYPVREEDGTVVGAVVVARDVSETEQARRALRIQRDLSVALSATSDLDVTLQLSLEAALEASGMDCGGVYLRDERDGTLTLAHHRGLPDDFVAAASQYAPGSPQAELVARGEPHYTTHAGLDVPPAAKVKAAALRGIAVLPVRSGDRVVACLNIASTLLDEVPPSARAVLETVASQIGHTILRARAEAAARQSRVNLQTLFDSVDEFLFVLDMEGRILRVNDTVQRRLGFSEQELVGQPVLAVHPQEQWEEATRIVGEMLAGQTASCPIPLTTRDGTQIPVETRITRGRWDGQEVIFGISRDVTERLRAERLITEALREKEALLREIHHRVKNNLQVVSSLLSLQREHVADPASLELFRESQARIRAMALVHDRLCRSASLARIDFSEYLHELALFLFGAYQATAGDISLDVQVRDVEFDMDTAVNMGLIVSELISNALKHAFTGDQRGELRVSLERADGQYELVVADDGIGFPPGVDPLATESLGLQLVVALVTECKGAIEVEAGRGTTFKIRFPTPPRRNDRGETTATTPSADGSR